MQLCAYECLELPIRGPEIVACLPFLVVTKAHLREDSVAAKREKGQMRASLSSSSTGALTGVGRVTFKALTSFTRTFVLSAA